MHLDAWLGGVKVFECERLHASATDRHPHRCHASARSFEAGSAAPGAAVSSQCGGMKTGGDFVHTLTLADIASGWTECIAMPVAGVANQAGAGCRGSRARRPSQPLLNSTLVQGLLLAPVEFRH
jgi:hypothetical protein